MITRQYTPPTCTLAVMARSPLMARLLKQPVLEDFEFNLRFDDPRLTEAEYIRVKGDRPQLEQLYQTVTAYVEILLRFPPQIDGLMGRIQGSQDILSVSSGKFLNSIPAGSSPDLIARGSKQGLQNPLSLNSRDTSADFLETASKHRSLDRSSIESSEPIKVERQENWEPVNLEIPAPELPPDIYLKPAGWLYHDLFLGSLADEQSGPYVHLSALQLFDLTTALDAYSHDDLADMPVRESRGLRGKPLVFAGLRTALTILVGIGAATGIVKLINHHHQNSASSPIPASTPQLLSPPPNLVVEQPLPTWQTPPPASAATPNLNVASNLPTIDTAPLPVPPPLFAAPPASPPGSIPDLAVEAMARW
ncbi:MAG: DUF4335 domain-containing protein [Oscillatoriales cyanobacterium RM2_1_1]|nr:DUF4335 domain-containing protein [Oscillatoriales cyanobacterium RM2_1_1]